MYDVRLKKPHTQEGMEVTHTEGFDIGTFCKVCESNNFDKNTYVPKQTFVSHQIRTSIN